MVTIDVISAQDCRMFVWVANGCADLLELARERVTFRCDCANQCRHVGEIVRHGRLFRTNSGALVVNRRDEGVDALLERGILALPAFRGFAGTRDLRGELIPSIGL